MAKQDHSSQWVNVKFDVSDNILGCDVELQDGSSVRLGTESLDDAVFKQSQTGELFNTRQMISNLLMKTNTRKQDLIKPAALAEAFEKGVCVGKPDLDIRFTPPGFALCTGDAERDIKRIVFDVEFTIRPKKNA